MKNVLPFRAPTLFAQHGIDWTNEPATEHEQTLRKAYLTFESSSAHDGLSSLILLALATRRQGTIAHDLREAADLAEIVLTMQLRKHQEHALTLMRAYLTT